MGKSAEEKLVDAVQAIRDYSGKDTKEAAEALESRAVTDDLEATKTEGEEPTPLGKVASWAKYGLTFLSKTVADVHANHVHNPKLKSARSELVLKCIEELTGIEGTDEKLDRVQQLMLDNMALSKEFLGADQIHSGSLHKSLLAALELDETAANKLCIESVSKAAL